MNDRDTFQRWAAVAAIVSSVAALASLVLPLPAIDWDFEAFADPVALLRRGGQLAGWMKASLLLDMVGYYLLIVPLVMVLEGWLRQRGRDWARLFAGCLLVYVLLGAGGAAVLAGASPRLMTLYNSVAVEHRFQIEGMYNLLWDSIYGGLWNILEVLVAGVGWFGLGWLLRRERPFAGVVTMVLGASCLADSIGNVFGVKALAEAGLYLYLILAPLWALGLGVQLLRRPITAPAA